MGWIGGATRVESWTQEGGEKQTMDSGGGLQYCVAELRENCREMILCGVEVEWVEGYLC